jgi:glycosyltransferase involved in cell wall biosynthesis
MLSIIISSYQPHYYQALEKNIAETIGIPYEVIKVDNPGKMGICEAYNHGAQKAQYDYLLFLHEDVLFETQNWGLILTQLLSKKSIGCVGLAGGDYVSSYPLPWWQNKERRFFHLNQISTNEEKKINRLTEHKNVIFLDGVFIACRRNIFLETRFSDYLQGFHGYDMDFSWRASQTHQNIVSHEITLTHFSAGHPNIEWFKSLILIWEQSKIAPKSTTTAQLDFDIKNFRILCRNFKISPTKQIYYLWKFYKFRYRNLMKIFSVMFRIAFLDRLSNK